MCQHHWRDFVYTHTAPPEALVLVTYYEASCQYLEAIKSLTTAPDELALALAHITKAFHLKQRQVLEDIVRNYSEARWQDYGRDKEKLAALITEKPFFDPSDPYTLVLEKIAGLPSDTLRQTLLNGMGAIVGLARAFRLKLSVEGRNDYRLTDFLDHVPLYNSERYLAETIQSILAQTYPHFQVMGLESCSTDNTVAILEGFHDLRIQIIPSDHRLSIEKNWARILDLPLADYMTIAGHDDRFEPGFLQEIVRLISG